MSQAEQLLWVGVGVEGRVRELLSVFPQHSASDGRMRGGGTQHKPHISFGVIILVQRQDEQQNHGEVGRWCKREVQEEEEKTEEEEVQRQRWAQHLWWSWSWVLTCCNIEILLDINAVLICANRLYSAPFMCSGLVRNCWEVMCAAPLGRITPRYTHLSLSWTRFKYITFISLNMLEKWCIILFCSFITCSYFPPCLLLSLLLCSG